MFTSVKQYYGNLSPAIRIIITDKSILLDMRLKGCDKSLRKI